MITAQPRAFVQHVVRKTHDVSARSVPATGSVHGCNAARFHDGHGQRRFTSTGHVADGGACPLGNVDISTMVFESLENSGQAAGCSDGCGIGSVVCCEVP